MALMLKDMRLAKEASDMVGADTALGHHAEEIYAKLDAAGLGGADFSAVINAIRERSNKK
jgi:3-hydroxyisobutyrate dehydrogenase